MSILANVNTITQSLKNINMKGRLAFRQPMAELSSFKVGGPADIAAWPEETDDILAALEWARAREIPWTVIGGGSNILVSDRGIRGLVIFTTEMDEIYHEQQSVMAGPGSAITHVSAYAAEHGLAGLDFIYSMPGSTGGALWMNARCYGSEIADVLDWVEYIDVDSSTPELKRLSPHREDFAYKHSPFQKGKNIILNSAYSLKPGNKAFLWTQMRDHEADRRSKGHFAAPCAGSIFKNNRDFGLPSGKIIDSLNMRGTEIGGARISDLHANIIVNDGTAKAADIARLIELIHQRVLEELGFDLEPEVIKVGEW